MTFSTLTTKIGRWGVAGLLVVLFCIGMAFPALALHATTTSKTGTTTRSASNGAIVQLVYTSPGTRLDVGPPAPGPTGPEFFGPGLAGFGSAGSRSDDPGCQGDNAGSPICQNSSGGSGP